MRIMNNDMINYNKNNNKKKNFLNNNKITKQKILRKKTIIIKTNNQLHINLLRNQNVQIIKSKKKTQEVDILV